MIRNLNPLSFQGFGTLFPERAQAQTAPAEGLLRLTEHTDQVYRAVCETWLRSGEGMTVLSVSKDGTHFAHYYLDKTVCIRAGIFYCLSAFQGVSTAYVTAQTAPEAQTLRVQTGPLEVRHRIQVGSIYTFFYQERERGFFFPGEAHPMLELTYVDKGAIHSVAEGQDLLLEQGDMAIYGPNQWHMQYADIDTAPCFVTITFQLEGDRLESLLNRKFQTPQRAVALLQQLLQERDRLDAYSNDMMISLLGQLLLTVLRESSAAEAAPVRTAQSVRAENELVRRAQQYISAHIQEKLTVPLVAHHVDVSPSYLTALFHKNLQISPGEYIRRIKLQQSKQMIREGNLNFTEIAAALRYSTVHHFSRQFKEKFGITPTQYAKSIR